MDASTIRLILIVVGTLLILALYLWERHREKREGDEYDDADDFLIGEEDELDAPYEARSDRREPVPGIYDDEDEEPLPATSRFGSWSDSRRDLDDPLDDALDAPVEPSPRASIAAKPAVAAAEPSPEPLLLQLSVSARRHPFKGVEIMDVAERCGLHPGAMDIFHCFDEFEDETRVYFSMANMVKPGSFPFDAMETFTTPGLMLFAQLEGDPEDMTILDEMVATARKLALALNGEVLDDTRRPLTVKKEEEMRQAVFANEKRWARIGSR